MTDVNQLPPTQYLILEVLAARHRTGEKYWTFPLRVRAAMRSLEAEGLVIHRTSDQIRAWLTESGKRAVMSPDYSPPNASKGCVVRVGEETGGCILRRLGLNSV